MAAISDLLGVAREAAGRALSPTKVLDVEIAAAIGSDGDSILRVTILVPDDQVEQIDGDHFLDAISQIGREFERAGDERFAVVSYMTPSERQQLDDPES